MTTPPPPQPRLRSIALGVMIVAVGVVMLCSASAMVKWAGMPLLVLPRVLGLIESVHRYEIVTVPLAAPPTALRFPAPETYAVYLSDLSLLEITNLLEQSDGKPWLVVTAAGSRQPLPVEFVERGLMPFDEPRVPGRPVYRVEIPAAGDYSLMHPRRPTSLYLVPDRISGKEGVIVAAMVTQVIVLAGLAFLVLGRPWRQQRAAWRRHQRERRAASDQVMQRRSRTRRPGVPRGDV